MALVWQSSWFWLMIFTVLLILVGCTVLTQRAPSRQSATNFNSNTVGVFPPTFIPPNILHNPTGTLTYHPTPELVTQRSNASPPDDNLVIDSPTCYSTAGGGYSCLGQIWNYSDTAIGDTEVQISVYDSTGEKIGEETAAIEQRLVPNNAAAPYRILINAENVILHQDNLAMRPSLMQMFPPRQNIRQLDVSRSRGHITDSGRYRLSVTIGNNTGAIAHNIRLITTLDSLGWGIVGYHVYEVEESINDGGEQLINLEIIPQALPDTIQHNVHAEGLVAE